MNPNQGDLNIRNKIQISNFKPTGWVLTSNAKKFREKKNTNVKMCPHTCTFYAKDNKNAELCFIFTIEWAKVPPTLSSSI